MDKDIETYLEEKINEEFTRIRPDLTSEASLNGHSKQEILNKAQHKKNKRLEETGKIENVREEAERAFRNHLRSNYGEDHLENYLEAKRTGDFEGLTLPVDDTEFKQNHIEKTLTINPKEDSSYIEQSAREVIEADLSSRYEKATQIMQGQGLTEDNANQVFIHTDRVTRQTSDILFPDEFERNMWLDQDHEVLTYLCLRHSHDEGEIELVSHLDDVITKDKQGRTVNFLKEAITHQLDATKDLNESIRATKNNNSLTALIADYEHDNFDAFPKQNLDRKYFDTKINEYISTVDEYLPDVEVVSRKEFFNNKGVNDIQNPIYESLLQNDGEFLPREEVHRSRESYQEAFEDTLNNWTPERNKYYTASSLSRIFAEGVVLAQEEKQYSIIEFNKEVVNGQRANRHADQKIPGLSISGINGIEYLTENE